jgi:FkbM family methyltransferase
MNSLIQILFCARRLKHLHRYDLLSQSWNSAIQDASKLAEDILPLKPRYVFDGGFHKGWFSYTLSLLYPDIEVCGCDPIDYRDEWLISSTIKLDFFNVALGEIPGSAELKLVNDSQLHSLLSFNKDYEKSFGVTYKSTNKVKAVSISNIDVLIEKMGWLQCDLLKLDLQGSELSALKGAEKSFEKIRAIYLEISFEQIYEKQAIFSEVNLFLKQRGFKLSKILNPRGGKYLLQADALYLNSCHYPPC